MKMYGQNALEAFVSKSVENQGRKKRGTIMTTDWTEETYDGLTQAERTTEKLYDEKTSDKCPLILNIQKRLELFQFLAHSLPVRADGRLPFAEESCHVMRKAFEDCHEM
jgi:hypothetical protein